jgi:glycosyltransferase involved in cell wall biosynthesis
MDLSEFARFPSRRVAVIPNPIDKNRLTELAREPVDHPWFNRSKIPIIVGLGELTNRKGFDTLIQAFSLLRTQRKSKLLIMGRGRGRADLEKLVTELNLKDDVWFTGFLENPFPYLSNAHLFVQASHYEGFGMALIEALALGVPAVATDCPSGPREILQDGRFGSLVPIGNSEAMAKQMNLTLDSPPDPSFLMQAATPYSLKKVTDRYLQVLGLEDAT